MANPHRGEVTLAAGEETYTLLASVNALCELEDALEKPFGKIAEELEDQENLRFSTARVVLWALLREHHPDVDVAGAGRIMHEAGATQVFGVIGEAFRRSFPEAEAQGAPAPGNGRARGKRKG